jgi:hypothetical protein
VTDGGASGPLAVTRRHVAGLHTVDEWGLDEDWIAVASAAAGIRWSIHVGGADHVPADGPALIVLNHRPLAGSIAIALVGVHRASGRVIRVAGIPDVAPLGVVLRRLGGVIDHPQEIAVLLRDGRLPAVPSRAEWRHVGRVGPVRAELVAPALDAGVPVLPVAVLAAPWRREARVEVGAPVRLRPRGGPLAAAELADAARAAIQRIIDEAAPPGARWLF